MTEKTAVIYCRISADATEEGLGVERQEQDCRKYAQKHRMAVSRVYTDNDTGASTLSKKPRPQYEAMLEAVQAGGVDVILAYSNSRLTRRLKELEDLIKLHEATGVVIQTVVSGNDDLSTADGRMVARIKASVDAAEAERTGERVKRAARQRAERGIPKKGRYRTFGYDNDFKVIDEEATIIKDAFRRVIAGHSLQSIASLWREQGVNMGNGKEVHFSTVKNIVKRPLYAGIAMHKGVEVGVSEVAPIIDRATYDAAQAVLSGASKPRGKNARTYLLSGIVHCSECLFPMMGGPGYKTADGIRQHVYTCRKVLGGCGKQGISGINLERVVLTTVRQSLIVRGMPGDKPAPLDFQPQINNITAQIEEIQASVRDQQMEARDAIPLISELSKQRRELERMAADQVLQREIDETRFVDWDNFIEATISEQKAITAAIVPNIIVHPADAAQWDATRVEMILASGKSVRGRNDKHWHFHPYGVVDGWRQNRIAQLAESRRYMEAKQTKQNDQSRK